MQPTVIALAAADLHLGDMVPVARSAEACWETAQIRSLKQLSKYQRRYQCPVLIAGDVFDKPVVHPWCINMALKYLPEQCYAIPGQHDLLHHNYSDVRLGAYWTLVEGCRVQNIEPGRPVEVGIPHPIRVHGFPFGIPVKPLKQPHDMFIEVALVHDYIWLGEETAYPGAPVEKRLSKERRKSLEGYEVAIFGDNHRGWLGTDSTILNCGCFQRRKADERNYQPVVGLIMSDGSIKRKRLDVSEDRWIDNVADAETLVGSNCADFIRELDALGDAALDFAQAVKRRLSHGVSKECREVVLRCLEGKK